jgi:hypothetical protein
MKIKIFARATVLDDADNPISDEAHLAALDGVTHDECFSDYLLDDPHTKELPARGVSGGYLRFRFYNNTKGMRAETEYDLREPLTRAEIDALVTYTRGQWSDGIGENFSQTYADKHKLFFSIESKHALTEVT